MPKMTRASALPAPSVFSLALTRAGYPVALAIAASIAAVGEPTPLPRPGARRAGSRARSERADSRLTALLQVAMAGSGKRGLTFEDGATPRRAAHNTPQ